VRATRTPPLAPADAELFAAARLRAARLQPYLAAAVFSLVPVPRPGYGTFGVDRWWRVYVDPEVMHRWGVEATAGVLLHEAHHVVRDHHGRADRLGVPAAGAHRWNLAGDAAINDDLVDDGVPLPDPVLPRHLGARPGLLEEAYYRHLCHEEAGHRRDSCGSGAGGAPLAVELDEEPYGPGSGVDDVDAAGLRRGVAHEVVAAERAGRPVSPGLVRWARDLLQPQVPWPRLLRAAMGRTLRGVTGRATPDWTRPDRRADARPDFPRPGLRRHRPDVAVVVDTSASMTRPLLDAAVTELDAILHRAGVGEVTVVVCDDVAVSPQRVRRISSLTLVGGGGTDLRIGIAAAAALRPRPAVVVVLTDGWTPWPPTAPAGTALVAAVIGTEAPLPAGPGITSVRVADPA
jgi:predicted metal-dependent peptidase